jgi:hypothetical protein
MAGNGNWRHGQRSRAAILSRKRSVAVVKAAAILLGQLGAIRGRVRRAPLRGDQVGLLPAEWQPWFPGASLTAPPISLTRNSLAS